MNKKKIMSLIMALVMLVGVFSPLSAFADTTLTPNDGKPETQTTGPDQPRAGELTPDKSEPEKIITVNLVKVLMSNDQRKAHNINKEYDPVKGVQNFDEFFGTGAKKIPNVYFVAIKKGEQGYKDFETKSNDEKDTIIAAVEAAKKQGEVRTGKTDTNGEIALKLHSPGNYKIYEVKHLSDYKGEDDKILAEQLAVPVILTLPNHARQSDGKIADSIYVYPKNTEDGPKVDKNVINRDKQEVKEASFDKTEEHTWVIRADIPTGMKDYKQFELEDVLEKALTYKGQVKVFVVDKGTALEFDENKKVKVPQGAEISNTDYTLTEPTAAEGGTLNVKFNETGIKNLVKSEGKQVVVTFVTTINDNAVMSKNIPNDVTLKYGHKPDSNLEKKPGEKPRVYTGGKKFKKYDSSKTGENALKGAKFVVKKVVNGEDFFLKETAEKKYEWIKLTGEDAKPAKLLNNNDLKKLESGEDGTFEIKGLEYDQKNRTKGTDYYLVEVEAPTIKGQNGENDTKYALLTEPVKFTVNDTSYYTDASKIDQGSAKATADAQLIDNKPITIPQTGGMGTVLFTVVGISLMAGAVVAMKRNREEA